MGAKREKKNAEDQGKSKRPCPPSSDALAPVQAKTEAADGDLGKISSLLENRSTLTPLLNLSPLGGEGASSGAASAAGGASVEKKEVAIC